MKTHLVGPGDAARFWSKVDKSGECWLWTATKDRKGYGAFSIGSSINDSGKRRNSMQAAHRVAYQLEKGPIGNGLHVLHTCTNPACVRPDHLFLGTVADNVRHMDTRGRRVTVAPHGSAHGRAVLSERQVREIFARFRAGGITQKQLALEYGVAASTINHIFTGRLWSHLGLAGKK
jgi:hypothetical protein